MTPGASADGAGGAGVARPSLRRDPHLPLYLLIAACVAADLAFAPLLPGLRASRGLSSIQGALLLSGASAATLIAPLPLGHLADCFGARRLVTAGGVLATAASLLLATTDGFAAMFLGRILIGLTNAIIWTAGTALATDRPGAVARAIGAGGAGRLGGPLLASALAGPAGPRAVFAAAGILTLAATIAFRHANRRPRAPAASASVFCAAPGSLRRAMRHRHVRAGALGLLLLGFTEGAANLLAPAQLHTDGLTDARIALLATIAAAAAFAAVTLSRRLVERHDATLLAACAAFALGVAWLVPAASTSIPAIASFLVVVAVARTLLNPASYLLAGEGAAAAGAGIAITLGATNLLLGAGGLSGPVLASLGLSHPHLAHASIALLCLTAAAVFAGTTPHLLGSTARAGRLANTLRTRRVKTRRDQCP